MIMKDIEWVRYRVTVTGPEGPGAGRFGLTEGAEWCSLPRMKYQAGVHLFSLIF